MDVAEGQPHDLLAARGHCPGHQARVEAAAEHDTDGRVDGVDVAGDGRLPQLADAIDDDIQRLVDDRRPGARQAAGGGRGAAVEAKAHLGAGGHAPRVAQNGALVGRPAAK